MKIHHATWLLWWLCAAPIILSGCKEQPKPICHGEFDGITKVYVSLEYEDGWETFASSYRDGLKISSTGAIQFPRGMKKFKRIEVSK